ncbi:MAG: thymidine kinase [Deltaproteobacteria bacterium]|nr:thymidine kinase [Nannocystaceae bacterium]
MAKLYFRHGAMDSAKTMNLLAVAHNYRKQGKRVLLLAPELDDRFGRGRIASRSGLEADADVLVHTDTVFELDDFRGIDCVLVDEVQFMSPAVIDQLWTIKMLLGVPVICYGLRTDFRTRLFPGALRLMELADSIEEIKVTCQLCNRKAVFNLRSVAGRGVVEGEQIVLGDVEYAPVCSRHYLAAVGWDGLARLGMTLPRGV